MVEIATFACWDSTSMRSVASWRASWALVACSVTGSSPSGARVAVQARGGPVVVHEHIQQLVVTERVELVDTTGAAGGGLPRRWRAAWLLTTPASRSPASVLSPTRRKPAVAR